MALISVLVPLLFHYVVPVSRSFFPSRPSGGPLHHGEKRKRESHEQACMGANELPTLPEQNGTQRPHEWTRAKRYAAFPRVDP